MNRERTESHHVVVDDLEAVVLGGGPAGCAAATMLARRGHRVALVTPAKPPAGALAQSVPPSALKLLDELGVLPGPERASFHPNEGNTVWWGDSEARTETFTASRPGFHTDRAGLEAHLTAAARECGVLVRADSTARAAREHGGGWSVRCQRASGAVEELEARWVLDATGRRGLLARAEGRVPDRSTTTLALVARFRRADGWPGDTGTHTLVESYRDGWAWSVPLSREVRCFTAMVDPRFTDFAGRDVSGVLDAELGKTSHLRALVEGAEPMGPAWACPASLYTARRFARQGLLLVGDAGSFIDPLSSYGVKKALSSGWLAGVAVHTALVEPSMTGTATDFFDAREREVYVSYRRASAAFFGEAAEVYGHAYWTSRSEAARAASAGPSGPGSATRAEPGPDPDVDSGLPPGLREADVRHAFDEIRRRQRLKAAAGDSLRRRPGPLIENQRIVLADQLVSDAVPGGVRFFRGVDLDTLVRTACEHDSVPDAWAAYNAASTPVPLPEFLTALSVAFASGFLRHRP